ncbi:cAMP-dependent protein kinase regulatory subunit [Diplonema papillatum]|nr:cAMP-dependent protein kinase regulatory subunit [Diplonema papillatum]
MGGGQSVPTRPGAGGKPRYVQDRHSSGFDGVKDARSEGPGLQQRKGERKVPDNGGGGDPKQRRKKKADDAKQQQQQQHRPSHHQQQPPQEPKPPRRPSHAQAHGSEDKEPAFPPGGGGAHGNNNTAAAAAQACPPPKAARHAGHRPDNAAAPSPHPPPRSPLSKHAIAPELQAQSPPVQATQEPSNSQPATFKTVIKQALELAKDQRARIGKFRKDEKHATMELYEVLGLECDEFLAPPNELQIALRSYTFPPRTMASLQDRPIDKLTLEEILGPVEAAKRIASTGIELATPSKDDASSASQLKEKLRRQAVSSEAGNQATVHWESRRNQKSAEQIQEIEKILHDNILFASLDSRDRKVLMDALDQEDFKPGDAIITQGDDGDSYYVIQAGRCQITIKDEDEDEPKTVGFIGTGDSFGELGLMYGTPRAATIIARTDVVCWVLDRESFRGVLLNVTMKKRDQYMDFLDDIPILSSVEPYEKARIADVLEPVEYPPNTIIVEEDTEGDNFYFIEVGKVQVSTRADGNISVLGAGQYFGELALLFSQPRKATVTTMEKTHLVLLNRKHFTNYLGSVESILKRSTENYSKYMDQAVQVVANADNDARTW